MKIKQKREWCDLSKGLKFDINTKSNGFRCACGRRLKLQDVIDYWDTKTIVRGQNLYFVPEIVFKVVPPHKKKVKYVTLR